MVGQTSLDAWVRTCLTGQDGVKLDFHPFYDYFSTRAQADSKAATVFMDAKILQQNYKYADSEPHSIVAGILSVRLDILLAEQYVGVAGNISSCLADLSINKYTPAQAVYIQLWSYHQVPNAHLLSVSQPLIPQQCQTLSQLLTQPQKLAEFLCDFEVQQPVKHCDDNEYPLEQTQQFDDALTDVALTDEDIDAAIELEVNDELADSETPLSSAEQGEQQVLPSSSLCYQVYSRRYDNQVSAASLAPRLNYGSLKTQILAELPEFAGLSRRLANKLRRHLLSLEQSVWQDELEEGYLNGARLSALVASPSKVRPFRQLIKQPLPKTAVTLLIDCSGSMKGKPLLMTAAWVDALVGALELCQVNIEVLGFTTGHWDDGPVFQQWQKCQSQSGSELPGRLNDLLHVEFKRFDQPWRRARNGLSAVLEPQWQKENIDGEALSWAYQRLKVRAENKKILFVLSDAKPFDQLTGQNNGSKYLEEDLLRCADTIQQDDLAELIGIGVGHRVCRVYPTSVQINQLNELPQVMLDTLLKQL